MGDGGQRKVTYNWEYDKGGFSPISSAICGTLRLVCMLRSKQIRAKQVAPHAEL